jgi:hypothetical protein
MGTLAQTVLPFKLEATEELLTANAGLALFGEFMRGLGLSRWLAQEMPKPGSGRGYESGAYVTPLVLMLARRAVARWKTCARSRAIRRWRRCSNSRRRPARTPLATGCAARERKPDWRAWAASTSALPPRGFGRAGSPRIRWTAMPARSLPRSKPPHFTYKGEQGYMPMIGHLAEAGVVIHEEFREGNIAPATDNLEFIQACEARMPNGHRIAHVRLDSAGYQAGIFNYCEDTGKTFAIGGRLDAPTQKAIAEIPEADWKHYADCAVAETVHSMNETKNTFRLIVVKYERQAELFDDKPRYHVIASNRVESTADTLIWYRQRGEVSENGIKELKIGFGMERMPCGQLKANAAFFRIGVIAHNLFVLFKHSALAAGSLRHKVATVRWRLFHLPGKVVRHAGAWVLKVAAGALDLFRSIRTKSFALAQAMSP